ncbi:cysteine synthase [Pseudohyphozyma bogoriensis]|nr:cysteine synthase [Pseudohyphozyma bogoriensis]
MSSKRKRVDAQGNALKRSGKIVSVLRRRYAGADTAGADLALVPSALPWRMAADELAAALLVNLVSCSTGILTTPSSPPVIDMSASHLKIKSKGLQVRTADYRQDILLASLVALGARRTSHSAIAGHQALRPVHNLQQLVSLDTGAHREDACRRLMQRAIDMARESNLLLDASPEAFEATEVLRAVLFAVNPRHPFNGDLAAHLHKNHSARTGIVGFVDDEEDLDDNINVKSLSILEYDSYVAVLSKKPPKISNSELALVYGWKNEMVKHSLKVYQVQLTPDMKLKTPGRILTIFCLRSLSQLQRQDVQTGRNDFNKLRRTFTKISEPMEVMESPIILVNKIVTVVHTVLLAEAMRFCDGVDDELAKELLLERRIRFLTWLKPFISFMSDVQSWGNPLLAKTLLLGLTLGVSFSMSLTAIALFYQEAFTKRLRKPPPKRIVEIRADEVVDGVEGLIGNTPLVRIKSLSDLTGVDILGKCEFLNPFGSVKDRVSLRIIKEAEEAELIHPFTGSCIFEGTSGSTGISIAGIARSRGYKAHIVLPDDVAKEKVQMLEALGAKVEKVRPVSIVDKKHYVNLARVRAKEFGKETIVAHLPSAAPSGASTPSGTTITPQPDFLVSSKPAPSSSSPLNVFRDPPRGLFADQFENLSNLAAHEDGTAEEIWKQTSGMVTAFVSGAGTGGTIAGTGKHLKGLNPDIKIVLSDPQGSGLFHKVVEGIGLNRLTRNFAKALPFIDDAIQVTDAEAVAMSRHLAQEDGLFLGSSSAVNLVACLRLAKKMGEGRIVTILWNDDYLRDLGIPVSHSIQSIWEEE